MIHVICPMSPLQKTSLKMHLGFLGLYTYVFSEHCIFNFKMTIGDLHKQLGQHFILTWIYVLPDDWCTGKLSDGPWTLKVIYDNTV